MSPKRILIVEDEETSRKVLELALRATDRQLLFAGDGNEAVRMAMEHRPDLIIMDIMLPKLDGYQAAKIIKGDPALKGIPIVALTARTVDYKEVGAREAGCDDYITKPFRVGPLRDRLAKYLE